MTKKTYNAPQMKLIEVKDDIIATSPNTLYEEIVTGEDVDI